MSERPVGLTKDAGWEIGVSRTFPVSPEAAWDAITSPEGVAIWVGEGAGLGSERGDAYATADGTEGELRSRRPGDRVRLTRRLPGREDAAIVQVVVRPAASGASIRFHTERLRDAEEREAMREHWRGVLDELGELLGKREGV
jgi:uncharacterized protein YndB with AHSA1/START domain